MLISDWQEKVKNLEPNVREKVLTFTCTRWLQDFNKLMLESPQPEKIVAANNTLLSFTLIQLTQIGEPRQAVFDFFTILEEKNPFTKVKVT